MGIIALYSHMVKLELVKRTPCLAMVSVVLHLSPKNKLKTKALKRLLALLLISYLGMRNMK
jgi:hypothetical protein